MTNLDGRAWKLLKLLIQYYIHDGQPIGSKRLADHSELELSSATIRNVMAELEKAGYVASPHTSAGRIPTEQAYRLFVDELLTTEMTADESLLLLKNNFHAHQPANELLETASSVLSDITRLTGIVSVPKRNKINLRHIEFLPLSEHRVLAILVFNDKEVQNRIIQTAQNYSQSELQQAANFINAHFTGSDLLTIRQRILKSMQQDRSEMDSLMRQALEMANKTFEQESNEEDCFVAGQSHLLDWVDVAGVSRLKSLFELFTQKQNILALFDRCLEADRMQIFIGKEAGSDVFDNFSVVATPYEVDGEILGVLGVIGPTRMQYDHVISVVNLTARLLSGALSE